MAYSHRKLLARILKCKSGGEGDNGMKAVATNIMTKKFTYTTCNCICINKPALLWVILATL